MRPSITSPRHRPLLLLAGIAFASCWSAALRAEPEARGAERIVSPSAMAAGFGFATAMLDFDGDGRDEVAVSDVIEDTAGGSTRGVVYIFRRNNGRWQSFHLTELNSSEAVFGHSLAVGDFDDDGREDLLIGAPGYGDGGGAVYLFYYDSPNSLRRRSVIANIGASFGNCGYSLAVGDFNSDGNLDFATGCPTATVDGVAGAGRVQMAYGSGNATFSLGDLSQASPGIGGGPETGDRFGASLAAGHFNCGFPGNTDLAIGVPGETTDGATEGGALHVLFNNGAGPLDGTGSQLIHQGSADVPGVSGNRDAFASALAAGGFDRAFGSWNTCEDLAVGIPYDAESPGGAVLVLRATSDGLTGTGAYRITVEDLAPEPDVFPPYPAPDTQHRIGVSLLAASLGRGSQDDLVIGVRGYTRALGGDVPGLACVAYGDEDVGLLGAGRRCFGGAQFGSGADTDTYFGTVFAAGNVDGAGGRELAIGALLSTQVFVLRTPLLSDGFEPGS